MKTIKYIVGGLIVIIIIMMITNPSVKQFKEFTGDGDEFKMELKRTSNWMIFSEYEVHKYKVQPFDWDPNQEHTDERTLDYWGIFNNFYEK